MSVGVGMCYKKEEIVKVFKYLFRKRALTLAENIHRAESKDESKKWVIF